VKPVFNATKHNPPHSYGDCFSACLSSILESPVPHVLHDGCNGEEKLRRLDAFLRPLSLAYLELPIKVWTTDEFLDWAGYITAESRLHYTFLGITESGEGHYVVCHQNEIVHNPNPKAVIVRPFDDGYFWLGVLARRT